MTHIALTGNIVFLTLGLIVLSIVGSIVVLRYYWKYKLKSTTSRRSNSPLKDTSGLHAFGICMSLLAAIALMSWTKTERAGHNYSPDPIDYEDIIEIPATAHITRKSKPIPPAPTPNPIIKEVEDLVEVEKPEEIPLEIPVDARVQTSDVPTNVSQPAPKFSIIEKPADKTIDVIEIVSIAEQMPRFPGCFSDSQSDAEQKECTESQLMSYVYSNLKYPRVARENGIEGRVILQFVIDIDGSIADVKIVRDIGGGCGAAASKVIEDMVNKKGFWTPGKQSHRKVKVRYTLPVTFDLQQ